MSPSSPDDALMTIPDSPAPADRALDDLQSEADEQKSEWPEPAQPQNTGDRDR